jgi:hypothetical protein
MATVPFALVGGIWCVWALGHAFSVATAVGFLALAGVAAEFGVVMLIYLKSAWTRHRDAGAGDHDAALVAAIHEGAVLRVRPKAMTVAVILGGLLPIMWGDGAGSEVMQRIAAPMLGGMVSAPLLSMLVIPGGVPADALNGTTTTGTIRRANIAKLPLAGQYVSSVVEVLQGCTSRQSGLYAGVGYFNVTLNDAGNAATGSFEALDNSPGCTYYLPFTQAGSTATGNGTFSCNDGTSGDVEVENLRAYDDIVTIQMTRTFTSGETCVASTFLSGSK